MAPTFCTPTSTRRHPEDILGCCGRDDAIEGVLMRLGGTLAFGDIKSVRRGFQPDPNIRSDASIPPGRNSVTAYSTEFPDQAFEAARNQFVGCRSALSGDSQRRVSDLPDQYRDCRCDGVLPCRRRHPHCAARLVALVQQALDLAREARQGERGAIAVPEHRLGAEVPAARRAVKGATIPQ